MFDVQEETVSHLNVNYSFVLWRTILEIALNICSNPVYSSIDYSSSPPTPLPTLQCSHIGASSIKKRKTIKENCSCQNRCSLCANVVYSNNTVACVNCIQPSKQNNQQELRTVSLRRGRTQRFFTILHKPSSRIVGFTHR